MKKKKSFILLCFDFPFTIPPPPIAGFKKTSSLIILLVSKEKHELCVNNNFVI